MVDALTDFAVDNSEEPISKLCRRTLRVLSGRDQSRLAELVKTTTAVQWVELGECLSTAAAFTAAQVAFVLREPVKTVKKAFDESPIRARGVQKASCTVRTVDW